MSRQLDRLESAQGDHCSLSHILIKMSEAFGDVGRVRRARRRLQLAQRGERGLFHINIAVIPCGLDHESGVLRERRRLHHAQRLQCHSAHVRATAPDLVGQSGNETSERCRRHLAEYLDGSGARH